MALPDIRHLPGRRRAWMRRVAVGLALLSGFAGALAGTARVSRANPLCPPDTLRLTFRSGGMPYVFQTDVSTDSTNYIYMVTFSGYSHATYDLGRGTSEAVGAGGLGGIVNAGDEYVLTGPPAGTPVSLTAQLSVAVEHSTYHPGWSMVSAEFREPGGAHSWSHAYVHSGPSGDPVRADTTFAVSLPVLAGTPFRLSWVLTADCQTGSVGGAAQLYFLDLPPDGVVNSCQGYSSTTTSGVAVQSVTWSRIKTLLD